MLQHDPSPSPWICFMWPKYLKSFISTSYELKSLVFYRDFGLREWKASKLQFPLEKAVQLLNEAVDMLFLDRFYFKMNSFKPEVKVKFCN